jgi:hypothetical protein
VRPPGEDPRTAAVGGLGNRSSHQEENPASVTVRRGDDEPTVEFDRGVDGGIDAATLVLDTR